MYKILSPSSYVLLHKIQNTTQYNVYTYRKTKFWGFDALYHTIFQNNDILRVNSVRIRVFHIHTHPNRENRKQERGFYIMNDAMEADNFIVWDVVEMRLHFLHIYACIWCKIYHLNFTNFRLSTQFYFKSSTLKLWNIYGTVFQAT